MVRKTCREETLRGIMPDFLLANSLIVDSLRPLNTPMNDLIISTELNSVIISVSMHTAVVVVIFL